MWYQTGHRAVPVGREIAFVLLCDTRNRLRQSIMAIKSTYGGTISFYCSFMHWHYRRVRRCIFGHRQHTIQLQLPQLTPNLLSTTRTINWFQPVRMAETETMKFVDEIAVRKCHSWNPKWEKKKKKKNVERCVETLANLFGFNLQKRVPVSAQRTTHVSKIKIERKEKRETTRRCVYVGHTTENNVDQSVNSQNLLKLLFLTFCLRVVSVNAISMLNTLTHTRSTHVTINDIAKRKPWNCVTATFVTIYENEQQQKSNCDWRERR